MKQGDPEKIYNQIQQIDQNTEGAKEKIETLTRQLEDQLLNYERGKEDHINLSHSLKNSLKVSIDHETLKLQQDRSSARLSDEGVSDDQFLDL